MPSAWDETPVAPGAPKVPAVSAWDATPADGRVKQKRDGFQTVADSGNAVGTGYFRALTRLAGLPVDTALNVWDLGKAAVGTAYQAATGKPAPTALDPTDRTGVVGSGDWLVRKAREVPGGSFMIDPANPDYEGGYLQATGGGLTSVMGPKNIPQAVNQAGLGVASNLGAKATFDATGDPALAATASLVPTAAQMAVTAATKRVVRGNEEGRQRMEQRIQDLKNAGINNPTLGVASGNQLIGGTENLLQSTPGAIGVMRRAREDALAGVQAKAAEAADLASPRRGAFEAGRDIQSGITEFRDQFKAGQERVYNKLDNFISPQDPAQVSNTRTTLAALNSDIQGAPALSKFFKNGKIQALEAALKSDTAGSPETVMVYPQPPKAGGGLMNAPIEQPPILVKVPAGPQGNTLPWEAVKKTRTLVGNEIADATLLSDVPRSKWTALYGGLSEDMRNTANQAGPQAEQAFNRANAYTRAGTQRLEALKPFAETNSPEQAFTRLMQTTKENGSVLQAVKKSLPTEARGTVAATVIERLGKANPSNQNELGDVFSTERFLTNWNMMTPKARNELFSGFKNSAQVRADVEAVAKASSMMRENSKMWANPSGTGANLMARGVLLGGAGSYVVNPLAPLAIGGAMGSANMLARALTAPTVVRAMAERNNLSPALARATALQLMAQPSQEQK